MPRVVQSDWVRLYYAPPSRPLPDQPPYELVSYEVSYQYFLQATYACARLHARGMCSKQL